MGMDRAREEQRLISSHTKDDLPLTPAGLTFLAWHANNLVHNATDGRYRLAVMAGDTEVDPIDMKYDKDLHKHMTKQNEQEI